MLVAQLASGSGAAVRVGQGAGMGLARIGDAVKGEGVGSKTPLATRCGVVAAVAGKISSSVSRKAWRSS